METWLMLRNLAPATMASSVADLAITIAKEKGPQRVGWGIYELAKGQVLQWLNDPESIEPILKEIARKLGL